VADRGFQATARNLEQGRRGEGLHPECFFSSSVAVSPFFGPQSHVAGGAQAAGAARSQGAAGQRGEAGGQAAGHEGGGVVEEEGMRTRDVQTSLRAPECWQHPSVSPPSPFLGFLILPSLGISWRRDYFGNFPALRIFPPLNFAPIFFVRETTSHPVPLSFRKKTRCRQVCPPPPES